MVQATIEIVNQETKILEVESEETNFIVIVEKGVKGDQGDAGQDGADGSDGADGTDGQDGVDGSDGADGQGVPIGGAVGQFLKKTGIGDFVTAWYTLLKGDVGLGNVDNTSDADKPVSTATQTALDLKVTANGAITGATKTKITYDSKGLVTGGADATTADIADSANKRYVTDAQQTVLGNTSGTNTGDQTITLTGAVTGSGTGSFLTTLANSIVTLAKMADVATGSVFYRKTTGTGAPEVQTLATLKTDLGLTGTNSGDQTITLTGDVAGSGTGSFAATIANAAVTLAKMANMATGSLFYRKTAGSGAPEIQTLATLKTDLGLTGTNSGDQTITLTGDVTGSGTGSFATAIGAGVIVNADVNASAGIDATKLAAGTVSNTVFGYLVGVTSAIQTQFSGKASVTQTIDIQGFIEAPANKDYKVVINTTFGFTINEVTTRSTAGTITCTGKINTTALGGTANSVSTTETTQTHSSANVVAVGDDVVLTLSSNSSCANMSFKIKGTRTLA